MLSLFSHVKTHSAERKGIMPVCHSCNVRTSTGSFEFHQQYRSGKIIFNLYCENCTKGRELGEEHGYILNRSTGAYYHFPQEQ